MHTFPYYKSLKHFRDGKTLTDTLRDVAANCDALETADMKARTWIGRFLSLIYIPPAA